MKIELAANSGFCFGVKHAIVKAVEEINRSSEPILVYGPLIHNPQTVEILENRGLKTINSLANIDGKQIAIRTHGIPLYESMEIKRRSSRLLNLTCPKVARVQAIIKKYSADGCHTIILGDGEHAEVVGLKSFASSGVTVISSLDEIADIPFAEKYLLVSQTTLNRELFDKVVSLLTEKLKNLNVVDTICDSTGNRQDDVHESIKKGIDTLIVAGGKNSANTTRLADIGRKNGLKTFHIETERELSFDMLKDSKYVLVTAGASTPGWIINNILERLYTIKYRKGNRLLKAFRLGLEFLVRTSSLSAIFAFFLTWFIQSEGRDAEFQGKAQGMLLPLISMLYIFAMYTTNNYFDRNLLKASNSYKYRIYKKYGRLLTVLSLGLLSASLWFIRDYSPLSVAILVCSTICGLMYFTTPVKRLVDIIKAQSIKNLYGSKLVTTLGWFAVTVMVPALQFHSDISVTIYASAFLIFLITMRHLIMGIVAYQGDFIFGRLTLPLWIGIKGTKLLCYILTALVLLACAYAIYASGSSSLALLLCPVAYYIILLNIVVRVEYPVSLKYEIWTDINFLLTAACLCALIRN